MSRYSEYVSRNMRVGQRNGDEWICFCPFHHNVNSPSFSINVRKGVWVCFSCGERGGIQKLSKKLATDAPDDGGSTYLRERLAELRKAPEVEGTNLYPEAWLNQFDNPTHYWKSRGFSDEIIERMRLGYDPLRNSGTIPMRSMKGEVIGVIRRQLDPAAKPKYLYPKGFTKNRHVWGAHLVMGTQPERLAVVEGAADALAFMDAGVAAVSILGNSISKDQARTIRAIQPRVVVSALDNDQYGRGRAEHYDKRKGELVGATGNHRIHEFLNGLTVEVPVNWGKAKDPGEMSVPRRRGLARDTVPFHQWRKAVEDSL